MTKQHYLNIFKWAEEKTIRKRFLCMINQVFPILLAVIYFFSILTCFLVYPGFLPRLIFRPLFCFLLVSILRSFIKAPRPYDVYDFVPLCGYHPGKNKSFPSRHSASAAIIAFELFHIWPTTGIFAGIIALFIGSSRILCGNHFIKDVIIAFVIAFLIYFL